MEPGAPVQESFKQPRPSLLEAVLAKQVSPGTGLVTRKPGQEGAGMSLVFVGSPLLCLVLCFTACDGAEMSNGFQWSIFS